MTATAASISSFFASRRTLVLALMLAVLTLVAAFVAIESLTGASAAVQSHPDNGFCARC